MVPPHTESFCSDVCPPPCLSQASSPAVWAQSHHGTSLTPGMTAFTLLLQLCLPCPCAQWLFATFLKVTAKQGLLGPHSGRLWVCVQGPMLPLPVCIIDHNHPVRSRPGDYEEGALGKRKAPTGSGVGGEQAPLRLPAGPSPPLPSWGPLSVPWSPLGQALGTAGGTKVTGSHRSCAGDRATSARLPCTGMERTVLRGLSQGTGTKAWGSTEATHGQCPRPAQNRPLLAEQGPPAEEEGSPWRGESSSGDEKRTPRRAWVPRGSVDGAYPTAVLISGHTPPGLYSVTATRAGRTAVCLEQSEGWRQPG